MKFTIGIFALIAAASVAQAQQTNFGMVGLTTGQSLRLNLVAWPPTPISPDTSCTAQLGFQDRLGNSVGPSSGPLTLQQGQSASITLNGNSLAGRIELLPTVVGFDGAYPPDPCHASVEVIDNALQNTTVAVPGAIGFPPNPVFGMLGVTASQTVRLNVVAFPPDPCAGTITFADKNGNQVAINGSPVSMNVNLSPGQAAHLDLPGSAVVTASGKDAEVHPIVALAPQVNLPPACIASVEVIHNATGATAVFWPPDPCSAADMMSCVVF